MLFSEVVQNTHVKKINIDIIFLIELKLSIATVNYSRIMQNRTKCNGKL